MCAKAKWPKDYGDIIDTYRNPTLRTTLITNKVDRKVEGSNRQASGVMKFNVNDAIRGSSKEAGIEGVMRDENGTDLTSLMIESNSSNAIKWVNQPSKGSLRLNKWILLIEILKLDITG
ncbi:Uncharacterized protein TCM_039350 [Theobroma cacao]|uniref:Uncharacterized protein n=1 Tax=Theobroma cacao TaxID=3641 RepID=A0A061GRD8_THECC|nr:Uncharacterized protein TCM_039350 [Theobroma cacao]